MFNQIFLEKLKSNFSEAIRVILTNKTRTLLTSLGIIFGVAAVITMLAIGKGAEKEILDQIKLVGVNNIVITPIKDKKTENEDGDIESTETNDNNTKTFSKGLDILDVNSIQKYIPSVKQISPEIFLDTYLIKKGKQSAVKLIGVNNNFFSTANITIESGKKFSKQQNLNSLPVCIIGKNIERKIFTGESAIGKMIKVKDVWLEVVGVTEEKFISENAQENLHIRNLNEDIYIPINTFLIRYKDRKQIRITKGNRGSSKQKNYHQIDRLVVQVKNTSDLNATSEVISRMLKRRHNNKIDFKISIPIQLLKQQQKTKQIFNIVLSIIAGISLLIGGIGIMNIMLASVLERTKEIGIIRAIGATQEDVILQFLTESVLVSIGGGIIGIVLGVISSYILEISTGIETILSLSSILLSFFVATLIGLIFGIAPAKSAASKSPIEAIRHE
ncbi:ABC transporter permease [Polaribacter septentrionalilitoris]|uniref:ABC transporter permease n=1 Tax=Polaribacter septentrionalilitoris TaxID=2494657 RepID=UPI00135A27CE|nr:ABC transporter permease [Polaribacter septentrionalilitoris]